MPLREAPGVTPRRAAASAAALMPEPFVGHAGNCARPSPGPAPAPAPAPAAPTWPAIAVPPAGVNGRCPPGCEAPPSTRSGRPTPAAGSGHHRGFQEQ
jgi:hypothetical protein